jgi:hypothetical protein
MMQARIGHTLAAGLMFRRCKQSEVLAAVALPDEERIGNYRILNVRISP